MKEMRSNSLIDYVAMQIGVGDDPEIRVLDQRELPFQKEYFILRTLEDVVFAIGDMVVRGAGLIGNVAAAGMYLAAKEYAGSSDFEKKMQHAGSMLAATRPTAVNLSWAVKRVMEVMGRRGSVGEKVNAALEKTRKILWEDDKMTHSIGKHGLDIIRGISKQKSGKTVNILTHCNAGRLAIVDRGTATAPVYAAFDEGIDIHVWVDETRPRNQGARLTAWELGDYRVPHTVIPDNAGGHLMQHGMVDMVIVGTDRTTRAGDVANKIGTYLKALAAYDNGIPFYVALPSSSFDWSVRDGLKEIEIEERNAAEVDSISGWYDDKEITVRLIPEMSVVKNYGFDVTPARLVTGLITERGVCRAEESEILHLFPEHK